MLTEENYEETINSYTKHDWQRLFALIPIIENSLKFEEMGDDKTPYLVEKAIVHDFRNAIYEIPIAVIFDWSSWKEGRKIANDDHLDFDSIDIPTKCKLITAIVRNDRFCEGALVAAFESGFILKVLTSIQRQVG